MNWNKNISLFLMLCAVHWSCSTDALREDYFESDEQKSKHLIGADKLAQILDNDSVVVIDFRREKEYIKEHIPGALNIWRSDIENDKIAYKGVIAPKRKIEELFSRLGIRNSDFIVIYDNNGSCDAARLWWVLDHYGFEKTALLNGGLEAWKNEYIPQIATQRTASEFSLPEEGYESKHYISLDDLVLQYMDTSITLIDTRSMDEYLGHYMKAGALDSGRIPRSINIDWMETVNTETQTFKTAKELRKLYQSYDVDSSSNIIVYCHTGVRSAHSVFVLTEILGYPNVRNYEGSWVEWSHHKMPLERGTRVVNN